VKGREGMGRKGKKEGEAGGKRDSCHAHAIMRVDRDSPCWIIEGIP
jgi:hypothetical protein